MLPTSIWRTQLALNTYSAIFRSPAHRLKRIRELIERRGCELIYLPSYSPDFNPIEEEALSKIKHLLRKIGARTKESLIEAMGQALAAVSVQDVRGFFVHCGYRTPAQQL